MGLDLIVGKVQRPAGLKINKDRTTGYGVHAVEYVFNKSILLPFDPDAVNKINADAKISREYFTRVIKELAEEMLPEVFPKGVYIDAKIDSSDIYDTIPVNPSEDRHHHSFIFEMKTEVPYSEQHAGQNRRKGAVRTSVVFSSSSGFFPKIRGNNILPISGLRIHTSNSSVELPGIPYKDEESSYIAQISVPIIQTLLIGNPLFFPRNSAIHAGSFNGFYLHPSLTTKSCRYESVKAALEFREKLYDFFVSHKKEIQSMANGFSRAKTAAKIELDKDMDNYKPDYLCKYFKALDRRLDDLRPEVPRELRSYALALSRCEKQ